MPHFFKGIDQQKKRQTLRKISLSAPSLQTYSVGNSQSLPIRLYYFSQKKIKITKKPCNTDKSGDEAKIFWQQVSTSLSRRKKEISPKLNISTIGRRAIISTSVLKRGNRSQKLVLGLATSMLVTITRDKAVENFEDGENSRTTVRASQNDKNLRFNLAKVLCIQYLIVFKNKSI